MKSIANLINYKNSFNVLISLGFVYLNNSGVNAEILYNNIDGLDFENTLNQNSVQFHEYENPKTLFDDFFGIEDPLHESKFDTNYQDLTLQIDSKNIREIYKKKLLEMTKSTKKNNEDKLKWSFFNKRI